MPTSRENIEKWSWPYWLLRYYQDFAFRLYFKTDIVGLERLPEDATLIFAPNHQNALMDALGILTLYPHWQPVFLARADIFKKPSVRKILTFLKIMPVYRIRDGYENLSLNDEVFLKTMDVLRNRNGLVILPEGNHEGVKRLRQLKKGIARIAFQAEDTANGTLNIHIVPVGLEYSHYVRFHSQLLIRIGKPIELNKYLALYRQNKALAYNALMAELASGMKKEMIHIEEEAHYAAYLALIDLFSERFMKSRRLPRTRNQKFLIDKELIGRFDSLKANSPDEFNSLMAMAHEYRGLVAGSRIDSGAVPLSARRAYRLPLRAIVLLVTLPLFIYGAVNNLIAILAPYRLSLKFADVQFHSSVRYVVALVLFPLTYILQILVFALAVRDWWLTLAYLASLPLSALLLYLWYRHFRALAEDLRVLWLTVAKPRQATRLNRLFGELYSKAEELVS